MAGTGGTETAAYEYGAFGELSQITGKIAKMNPFRFSTKFTDDENRLVYYGYRYFSTSTGRWLSRDPIEERGGLNLYGFVANNPINAIDRWGLEKLDLEFITSDYGIKDWLWADGPRRVENLSELLAVVEAAIGKKYDPEGKCGNCIHKLTITSHSGMQGYVGFSPIEGAAYGESDYYSGGDFSNERAAAAFAALGKYFCKDGKLYLMQCDAGGGDEGTAMLQNLSQLSGVPVTAPQVPTQVGRTPRCSKTAFPDGRIETSGDCDSTICIKKPTKSLK